MTVMRQVSFIGGKLHGGIERDGASFASSAAKSLPRKCPNDAVVLDAISDKEPTRNTVCLWKS